MSEELTHAEQAARIERHHAHNRDNAISQAMLSAVRIYRRLCELEDPYAFEKAVESLPVEVLVHVLQKKTDYILRQG